MTYYDILNVEKEASDKEILESYMSEAVKVHPDILNLQLSRMEQQVRFMKLCLAYAALSELTNRATYDAMATDLQVKCADRMSFFRVGDESDITEDDACTIWETACLSRGMVANKVLREYTSKQPKKQATKSPNAKAGPTLVAHPEDGEFEDITNTPEKAVVDSPSSSSEADDAAPLKPNLTIEDFIRSVKFGMRTELTRILFHYPEMVNELDSGGYTATHWAAKSGNVAILQTLHINGAKLNIPSTSEHSMMPLHWAASDGKLGTIKYLLDNNVSVNVQDGNGCTPVVIAAQHDQHNCCVFFLKNGADMNLRDSNGDTALHWAAYKGFSELVGLLSHTCPGAVDADDDYGQTPLHLAALRGNVDALEYLVIDCKANTTKKDKNGLTPLDLAVKKSQLKCEWALRRLTTSSTFELAQQLEIKRLTDSRILQNLVFGANEREVSNWPWRVVFVSNVVGTYYMLLFAFHESMADTWILHMVNIGLASIWWLCFWMCLQKNMSDVLDPPSATDRNISKYEEALVNIGNATDNTEFPNLCHSCHVVRPLRSKHCKIQRCCINKFDHFCPFVGNSVSRDNYKYFMGVITIHFILSVSWMITAVTLAYRVIISWNLTFYMTYLLLWMVMLGGLVQYHMSIIVQNMTTNENMNVAKGKYKHFSDSHNRYDNPFDLHDKKLNIWDGLFPQSLQLYTREEAKAEQRRRMIEAGADGSGQARDAESDMTSLLSNMEEHNSA